MARSSAIGNGEIRRPQPKQRPPAPLASRPSRRSLLATAGLIVGGTLGLFVGDSVSGRAPADAATPEPASSPVPGIPNASVFMLLRNTGTQPDRLIGASTEVADRVVLRTFDDAGGTRSEHLGEVALDLPPGTTVPLAPGEPQLYLLDVRKVLPPNTWFALTLTFARSGTIRVPVNVRWGGAPIITDVNRANRYTSGDITAIEPWTFPVGQAEIVTPIPATPVASPGATPDDGI